MSDEEKNRETATEEKKKASILTELKNLQTQIENAKTELLETINKRYTELRKILTSEEW